MKDLPPSQREKKRYLKFRVHTAEKIEIGDIVDAIWDASLTYLGTRDTGKTNFWFMGNKFDEDGQEGIIKVRRSMEDDFRAALCLINEIGNQKGFIEIEKTSGTLESL